MKCPNCGKEIADDSNFCEYCGKRTGGVEHSMQKRRLIRVEHESHIFGFLDKACVYLNGVLCAKLKQGEVINIEFPDQDCEVSISHNSILNLRTVKIMVPSNFNGSILIKYNSLIGEFKPELKFI